MLKIKCFTLVGMVEINLQLSILKIKNVKSKNQMSHLGGEGGGEEAAESNTAEVGDEQRKKGINHQSFSQGMLSIFPWMCLSPDFKGYVICMCCVPQ